MEDYNEEEEIRFVEATKEPNKQSQQLADQKEKEVSIHAKLNIPLMTHMRRRGVPDIIGWIDGGYHSA